MQPTHTILDNTATTDNDTLLEVKDVKTHFFTDEGVIKAVDGVNLSLKRGQTLCVVGESGCGKSVTARSILRIVPAPGQLVSGQIMFRQRNGMTIDLAKMNPKGARDTKDSRWRDQHDFSRADVLAEPSAYDWESINGKQSCSICPSPSRKRANAPYHCLIWSVFRGQANNLMPILLSFRAACVSAQ